MMVAISKYLSIGGVMLLCASSSIYASDESNCQADLVPRDSIQLDCTRMNHWKDTVREYLIEIGYTNEIYFEDKYDGDDKDEWYSIKSDASSSHNSKYRTKGKAYDVSSDYSTLKNVTMFPTDSNELHEIQTIYDQHSTDDDEEYRGKISDPITYKQGQDGESPVYDLALVELKTGVAYAESTGMDGAGNTQQQVYVVGIDGSNGEAFVLGACVNRSINS